MPDYSRFNVLQRLNRFSLLDQQSGWVWEDIQSYSTVLRMMNILLELEWSDDEYKRLRKLEGPEWERELTEGG